MKSKNIQMIVILVALFVSVGIALAQQDRYTVKALDGVSFSEFKGYENWQMSPSVGPALTSKPSWRIL